MSDRENPEHLESARLQKRLERERAARQRAPGHPELVEAGFHTLEQEIRRLEPALHAILRRDG